MIEAAVGTRTVTIERDFAHPPEKLWRALTQQHLIEEWLMKNDFAAEVGHRFHLSGEWGGVLDCEVLEVEPYETLSYSWDFAHDDPAYALTSVVTFTLTPTASGTHLRMDQSGFRPEQKQAFGGAHAGWKNFLAKLDEVTTNIDCKQGIKYELQSMDQANPPLAVDHLHPDGDRQFRGHVAGRTADVDRLFAAAAAVPDAGDRPLHVLPSLCRKVPQGAGAMSDWRAAALDRARKLIAEAAPDAVEERKWAKPSNPQGVPTWSQGGIICTGETYKDKVKLTFAQGASLADPSGLFNASLDAGTRRAIDIREGDAVDAAAFKALIGEAVAVNLAKKRR
jgi:uncharacterized protein YndB with AHSA1/START domain